MAGQYPSAGYVADSQTVLLRKICGNTAQIVDNGGGGAGSVTSLIAGTGISLTPPTGLGAVTINATGGGGGTANGYPAVLDNSSQTTVSTGNFRTTTQKMTFSGAAGNRTIAFNAYVDFPSVTLHTAGDKLRLDLVFPITIGLVITVYQTNALLVKLLPVEVFGASQSFTTDGGVLSATWDFVFDGAAWQYEMSNLPA